MAKKNAPRFPNLNDTDFPMLENINVYKYQNDFDYSRWQPDTKIRLISVPWNSDYVHVVKFADNAARDTWLDSREGHTVELETDFKRYPGTSIKVPLPYDIAARYNYLYLSLSEITSSDNPVRYESARGVRRACYFIENCTYRSPNATELELVLDVWTTYINDVTISSMMLERGHAPAYATSVSKYLENPKANCENLLTADVNFGSADLVAHHEFKPLAAATKYFIFASTIPYAMIDEAGVATDTGSTSAPTFADTSARWGYQYQVSNYAWASNGRNYAAVQTRAHPSFSANGNIPNGYSLYAIRADLITTDNLAGLQHEIPHFVSSVAACFVLPENLITLGSAHKLGSFTLYEVSSNQNFDAGDFELTYQKFNYPERARDFAKLYTFPYAKIEISDDLGNSFDVRIEDIDSDGVHVLQQLSIAYPFIKWNVLLDNVGGSGSAQYQFKDLRGTNKNIDVLNADILNYMVQWQIPTYALFIDGRTYEQMRNYSTIQNQREAAITNYHQSLRGTNTGRENTVDSNATSVTNTAATNSTSVTNTANAGTTARNNVEINIAASTNNVNRANAASTNQVGLANARIDRVIAADQQMQNALFDADTEAVGLTNTNNLAVGTIGGVVEGIGSAAPSIAAGAAAGAAVGAAAGGVGALPGAVVGGLFAIGANVLSAGISFLAADANSAVAIDNNAAHISATQNNAATKATWAKSANTQQSANQNMLNTYSLQYNSNAMRGTNDNNVANMNRAASNSATTSNANANRSATTSNNNATQSRNAGVENAKDSLRLAQRAYTASANQSKLAPAIVQGAFTGNAELDAFAKRGIHARIKTQSKSAIARTADVFRRFGYMYGGFWNADNLTCNKDYCYWLASDIYIEDADKLNNSNNDILESIFKAGVTVWSEPEKIGRF